MWETSGRREGREIDRQPTKAAKKAVAQPRRGQCMSCTMSWKHRRVEKDISDSEGQVFHQEQSDKGRTTCSFKGPG